MKPLFQFLTIAVVLTHSSLGFAQKEAPAISKLDPAMDVNKKAAADLDWHNVIEWGVEGRILPNQERLRWFDRLPDKKQFHTDNHAALRTAFQQLQDIFEPTLRKALAGN